MRDWPLLLVAAVFFAGAATRYVVEDGAVGALFTMLACLGSAAFGAWLYSVGVDKERDHHHLLPVKKKKEKEKP